MAYPNPIPNTNLGNTKDFLEYFKGCLSNYTQHYESEDYYDRWQQFIFDLNNNYVFPISKSQFYTIVRLYFPQINGAEIYTYSQTNSGWSIRMCNDWGKLKSIEQSLFGNTTSSSGNTLPVFNSKTLLTSIPQWQSASLSFLRFALCRFSTYGTGIIPINKRPAPTNPVTNVATRSFNWTNASGFTSLNDYEYIYNNSHIWQTPSSKPLIIPGDKYLNPGELRFRTKGDGGYILPSDEISNSALVPYYGSILEITNVTYSSGGTRGFNITLRLTGQTLAGDINIQIWVDYGNGLRAALGGTIGLNEFPNINTSITKFFPYDGGLFVLPPFNSLIYLITPNPVNGQWVIY